TTENLSGNETQSAEMHQQIQDAITASNWFTDRDKAIISRTYIKRLCTDVLDAVPSSKFKKAAKVDKESFAESIAEFESDKNIRRWSADPQIKKSIEDIEKKYGVKHG